VQPEFWLQTRVHVSLFYKINLHTQLTIRSFINDPDRWDFCALIATVSFGNADFLRHFLWRYLTFDAFMGIRLLVCTARVLWFRS
jgi:hypothetical protein